MLNAGGYSSSDLASSLDSFGGILAESGRHRESLAAIEEAVKLRRALAADNLAHLPYLAASLNNLGVALQRVSRLTDALSVFEEATGLWRTMATDNPAHASNLALSLDNFADALAHAGHLAGSLLAIDEAIDHYRTPAAEAPEHSRHVYARRIASLRRRYDQAGEAELAMTLDLNGPHSER